MMKAKEHRSIAFSLIEMMTALAVLGVGVVAVLHGMSGTLEGNRRIEQREVAAQLLRIKMAEYSALDRQIEKQFGEFESPFSDFGWEVEAKQTQLDGLFELSATVSWQGRSGRRQIAATTLVPQR